MNQILWFHSNVYQAYIRIYLKDVTGHKLFFSGGLHHSIT